MSEESAPTKLRWARGQKFTLTAQGQTALTAYHDGIKSSQQEGRVAFEAFRTQWSSQQKVEADDGLVLAELEKPRKLEELLESLADTGASREGVKKMVERLFGAGLVAPLTSSPGQP
ncbi:MAG: hypothetical protein QM723_28100 [Myxococcaceae bacterium]